MNEYINFPEDKIPEIVALLRRGLVEEKDFEIIEQIERQCVELVEEYWNT